MKKEKLSLKGIRNALSKDELKMIMAGSGPCASWGNPCYIGPPGSNCCPGLTCQPNDGFPQCL